MKTKVKAKGSKSDTSSKSDESKDSKKGGNADPKAAKNSLLAKQLAAMGKAWDRSKEDSKKLGGGGTTLSANPHSTNLTDARIVSSDKGLAVIFEFTANEDDEETGEKATIYCGIETEEKLVYLQRHLRRLGVDVDDFEITDLEAILEALVKAKPAVRIKVVEKDQYLNTYIDKLIEEESEASDEDEEDDDDDDAETEEEGDDDEEESDDDDEEEEDEDEDNDDDSDEDSDDDDEESEDEEESDDSDDNEEEEDDEDEEEEYVPKVGDKVSLMYKDKKFTGAIKEVNAKKKTATVTRKDKPELSGVPFADIAELVTAKK